ncbi:hypothetical protein PHLCEN_2v100 [Hermanssonia centrifuga]|uniref:Uncharacterized protein n=1 Tax=Hermanssonia centrifuga TaxID=98765 RepID=A0A2R6S6X7_9APHY|nr:hypothetical protein PHLCEN_2v100 [Hermanssonia centrifuga]
MSAFLRFITTDTAVHFHRAHLVDAVAEHHLPKDIAHFGKRLTSYSQSGQSGPITLQFADGSSANCDLLVGCDGIKSFVRHAMMEKKVAEGLPDFSKYMEPVWTGSIAYRALVPVDRLPKFIREDPQLTKPLTYCGKDKVYFILIIHLGNTIMIGNMQHIMRYCISQSTTLNVVAFVSQPELSDTVYDGPWATECDSTELDAYSNWEPRVSEFLKVSFNVQTCFVYRLTIPRKLAEKPMKWAIHDLRPLPIYVSENVALVGDADAYILANLLGHPSTALDTLSHALKAYEHVRLPLANNVRTISRNTGPMFEFKSSSGDDYKAIKSTMEHQWDWMSADGVEEQLQKALSKMMEALN